MVDLRTHRSGPVVHPDGSVTFRVWAPRAREVTLLLGALADGGDAGGDRHQLDGPDDDGWWSLRTEGETGTCYAYALDGGPPRPDPGSRRQPRGVHGASAVVDPAAWAWSDAGFRPPPVPAAVVYELHMPTFTPEGTFAAAADRLGALRDLGVTHVEVMPVNAYNGERGWGYDGVAWYAVHEPYGGPEAFARFVDACHAEGLAVILDVVYNHLGPSGNYLGDFGPYLTDRYTTPWGQAPNVDGPESDAVRAYIIGNALMWLRDYHVDALRLDAVHGIVDTSSVHLLAELSGAVEDLSEQVGRDLALIAETDRQDPQTVRPRAVGGLGLDAQWLDDLHHGIHVALTGESDGYYRDYTGLPDVAAVYQRGFAFDGRWSGHRRRTVGARVPADVSSRRFVTCVQNHDQIGNRARGDRLTTLVPPARVRAGIALLCLSPTTPLLFMGEEFGATTPFQFFSGHPEPELDRAIREGRREEFASFTSFAGDVPDPQDPATMEASRLNWDEADHPEGQARRRLWTDLLALRRDLGALGNGDRSRVRVVSVDTEHLAIVRQGGLDGRPVDLLIAANLTDEQRVIEVPAGRWRPLWSSDAPAYGGEGRDVAVQAATVAVPSETVVLLADGAGSGDD